MVRFRERVSDRDAVAWFQQHFGRRPIDWELCAEIAEGLRDDIRGEHWEDHLEDPPPTFGRRDD